MRLSYALHTPVSVLKQTMDHEDIALYIAYDRMTPMPDSWQQTAILGFIASNGAIQPEQIMPRYISEADREIIQRAREAQAQNRAKARQKLEEDEQKHK